MLGFLLGDGSPINILLFTTAKGLPVLVFVVVLVILAQRREARWFGAVVDTEPEDVISPQELAALSTLQSRRAARKAVGGLKGKAGERLAGRLQREQINLAMVRTRVPSADHPDCIRQRELIRTIRSQLEALPLVAASPVPAGAATATISVGPGAAPAPPVVAAAWMPTVRVPSEGMQAWDLPDPRRPPFVTLSGYLDLAVAERAGDWARVIASNTWTGWVDARRLVSIAT